MRHKSSSYHITFTSCRATKCISNGLRPKPEHSEHSELIANIFDEELTTAPVLICKTKPCIPTEWCYDIIRKTFDWGAVLYSTTTTISTKSSPRQQVLKISWGAVLLSAIDSLANNIPPNNVNETHAPLHDVFARRGQLNNDMQTGRIQADHVSVYCNERLKVDQFDPFVRQPDVRNHLRPDRFHAVTRFDDKRVHELGVNRIFGWIAIRKAFIPEKVTLRITATSTNTNRGDDEEEFYPCLKRFHVGAVRGNCSYCPPVAIE